ncbi:MAG TPA: hypothetical protein VM029_07870 [Opitutaceae bacterium]|nr:hypothetical protein [Opitutaceae bacterium]
MRNRPLLLLASALLGATLSTPARANDDLAHDTVRLAAPVGFTDEGVTLIRTCDSQPVREVLARQVPAIVATK